MDKLDAFDAALFDRYGSGWMAAVNIVVFLQLPCVAVEGAHILPVNTFFCYLIS
ncbi:MAG: hypothetical protein Q4G28_06510 [Neisseria sp.]|nr:hypothetical protein [Neisseria sp.]